MYKVIISTGHKGTFGTLKEANKWIAKGVAGNWWGLPDRWSKDEISDVSRIVDNEPNDPYTEYFNKANYTYTIEDITEENERLKEIENNIAKGKAAKAACDRCLDYVRGYNLENEIQGEIIADDLANILKLLNLGSAPSAKILIENSDNPQYNNLKSPLLELLKDY